MSANLQPAASAIVALEDAAEYLRGQIDGGDECRDRDHEISRHIRSIEVAGQLLEAYAAHQQQVAQIITKMQGALS